jgi:hypothetical protein
VFVGDVGELFDDSALRRRYKEALADARLRQLRFHDLRHTFGTRKIGKADIVRVKAWMGHADVKRRCATCTTASPRGHAPGRVGVHTGEIELQEDDIAGLAFHIAARVVARAGDDEILVSGSVPPLIAGSGTASADADGRHSRAFQTNGMSSASSPGPDSPADRPSLRCSSR